MTPLAHKIMMDQCQPLKKRRFKDRAELLSRMHDVHCFELTDVYEAAAQLGKESVKMGGLSEIQKFLPAPKTWLEYKEDGCRLGILLCQGNINDTRLSMALALDGMGADGRYDFYSAQLAEIDLGWRRNALDPTKTPVCVLDEGSRTRKALDEEGVDALLRIGFIVLGSLAMINSPRIIGRAQHMPHRGLERALIANQKLVGKFPLHAWTEIKLHVTPPKEAEGEHEAHLTGERALHFCRAHLRIRLGRLEVVKAHWRGNPAIGIKQSRYTVTA